MHRKTEILKEKYMIYKNLLTKVIKRAEKMYYLKKFNDVKNNITKTWQTIKNVVSKSQSSRSTVESIKIGYDNISNPKNSHYF